MNNKTFTTLTTLTMVILLLVTLALVLLIIHAITTKVEAQSPTQAFCGVRMGTVTEWHCFSYWGCGWYKIYQPMWCCGASCEAACYNRWYRRWGSCR